MNVRKRGLALLMCICMIFTLLPFSAFADGEKPYKTHSDKNGVVMDKTVTHVSDDTYKVTLEQYVKGSVTPGQKTPIDVVLVLDVSGSMGDPFGNGTVSYVQTYDIKRWNVYYIKDADGNYKQVSYCRNCGKYTDGCYNDWEGYKLNHTRGTAYVPMTSATDTVDGHVQFYTSSGTKIAALKSAVNSFIDIIARDNPASQIAIVKFAGNKTDNVGNDTYRSGGYTHNYTQIVKNLTTADATGAAALKEAVSGLSAKGATAADYGLEKAINVFGDADQVPTGRNRVVIMFTDGEPNHSNGFDGSVAKTAIDKAKTLKSESYGASVYTIGIFSGAEVGTTLPNNDKSGQTNRYMHLVSSNYPEASSMKDTGTGDVTKGFYKVASNANSLGSVFTQLGEAIGKPSITLGSAAVLTDNIAPNFQVPASAEAVEVFTADYDGKNFGKRTPFTGATVKVENGAVTVSGFNYSANFVSETKHPGTDNDFGKKLIVEFDITVDRTKTYGGTQPANAGANITLEGKEIASVDYPPVPVSIVNGFGASYKNSKTYDGKGFTIENEFKEMLKTNVLADGEKNNYVNITYTVTDKDNNVVGTYVVKANETTGTWTAGTAAATTSPDVGTYNYNVTCVVRDATENGAEPVTKSGPMTLSITENTGLTVSGTDYNGMYDGKSHGEAATAKIDGEPVVGADVKIEYKVGDSDWTTIVPTVTNVSDSTEVQVRATKTGYAPAEATYTLIVNPRTVTITGESATRTYTGQEIELTGITPSGLLDGHELSGVGYSAKGTDARTEPYPGEFSNMDKLVIKDADGNDVTKNYNPEYAPGALTINPIGTVTVTITGNHESKVYNGTEQSITGYTVKISDPKYTEADFKFTGDPKASRTDVGTTYMGLKAEQFENKNSNFDKVTFVIENDGYVEVTPRTVTLTSETASKPYDGTALTKPEVTVTGDGFVTGEVTDIKATGSVTNVSEGEVTNAITFVHGDAFKAGNYKIEKSEGKLSITPLAVTVTAKDYTKYVGEKDPVLEATVTGTINNDTVSYTISREAGETVGTYTITPAGAEAQGNYTVTYKAGMLTIKERPYRPNPSITDKITVEITGNSDSVVYDGTEHSVKDYTVKISDSRYTEKDFTFRGKALASGVNAGTYEMGLKADQFKNTNARFKNVEFIIKADGVLTITQRPLTITAGSAEGIAPVTCDKYTVEGLATGDKVDSVKLTGIQSEPGESPNVASDAVIKNAKGEDVTANYKITYVDGVLKAIEVLNKEIHFNYVIGYTDGTIRPNNDISRAEVATIFFRLLTDEARTQYDKTTSSFSDIKDGAWCCRAVSTLTNMGIIKGYTDGTFQPNKSITRAELATIIARFAKLDVNTKTFSDITGHWAQKSIELAAGNGWINGYEDGTFRPNNNITRAETFAMINRVLDRQTESVSDLLPTSEMNMWSDNLNENAWYYKDVQEATNYHKCDRVGDSVYEKWTEKVPDIDWASYQI